MECIKAKIACMKTKLSYLKFWCCRSAYVVGMIDQVCHDSPNCTVVEIKRSDHLREKDFKRLFEGLRNNKHVKKLVLAGLGLNDDLGRLLGCALHECNVEELDLDNNNFTGDVIQWIISMITQRNLCKKLTLRHQPNWDCNSEDMEKIAKELKKNRTLEYLALLIPIQNPVAIEQVIRKRADTVLNDVFIPIEHEESTWNVSANCWILPPRTEPSRDDSASQRSGHI